jgi:hypothetical protein
VTSIGRKNRARQWLAALAATGVTSAVTVFFVGSAPAAAAPVGLGTADAFAVLAGTTVTNTGPSVITGDLGVSPGSAVVGFPPGIVLGTVHAADIAAAQAQLDLTTAYNNAAGQGPASPVVADLGGQVLGPGVYNSAIGLGLTGTLTLDAGGDPNATFVFQAGSTLVTASASLVQLVNSAQACNVFWQVGSSATLGTNSNFAGDILALTSATVTTGTIVNGRVLARNGAVTLDTNTIRRSACSPTPPASTSPTAPIPSGNPNTGAGGTFRSTNTLPISFGVVALIGSIVALAAAARRRRTTADGGDMGINE